MPLHACVCVCALHFMWIGSSDALPLPVAAQQQHALSGHFEFFFSFACVCSISNSQTVLENAKYIENVDHSQCCWHWFLVTFKRSLVDRQQQNRQVLPQLNATLLVLVSTKKNKLLAIYIGQHVRNAFQMCLTSSDQQHEANSNWVLSQLWPNN